MINTANDAFRRPRRFDYSSLGLSEAERLASKLSAMRKEEFAVVYTSAHGAESYRVMVASEIRAFERHVRGAVLRIRAIAFGGRVDK